MSQSLKMMRGDFPPSSRETFFRLLTAQLQRELQGDIKGMRSFHPEVTSVNKEQVCPLVPLHDLLSDGGGASEAQLTDVWVIG